MLDPYYQVLNDIQTLHFFNKLISQVYTVRKLITEGKTVKDYHTHIMANQYNHFWPFLSKGSRKSHFIAVALKLQVVFALGNQMPK